tara:strand:- start:864 stop:1400 length:537 start_codon:yes stop_codon:yes gene_type:complete
MKEPLMPVATAVWLIDNTSLTFRQISRLCNLHEIEVQTIADGEIASNIEGQNPILLGQLTSEDIKDCEKNKDKDLTLIELDIVKQASKKNKTKYIPIAKRRDKPDAIAWLIKNYPDIPDSKIVRLIGTTKKTIESIKDKSYGNYTALQLKDPVLLGLCTQSELNLLVEKFHPKPKEEG